MQVEQCVAEAATVEVERLREAGPKAFWGSRRHRARRDRLLDSDRRDIARPTWQPKAGCRLRVNRTSRKANYPPESKRDCPLEPHLEAGRIAGARIWRLVTVPARPQTVIA